MVPQENKKQIEGKKMNIKSFDFDTEHGFAWIVVEGKNEGEELTVQCCLVALYEDGEFIEFKEAINCSDCGYNWGICGDVNEKAFRCWGEDKCMEALFSEAKENGILTNGF